MPLDVKLQLSDWKPLLNFLVPFSAELLICALAFIRAWLISQSAKPVHKRQEPVLEVQKAMHHLNEIAVGSDVEIKGRVRRCDTAHDMEDPLSRGHHAWPILSVTPSHRRAAFRTHTNSLCIFDAEELLEWKDDANRGAMPIRPLPKETPERIQRHKSAGCMEDVTGTRRHSELDRLHVFTNGLYSDGTYTPRDLRL